MEDRPSGAVSTEPEPPRYADETAEELEDQAALDRPTSTGLPEDRFTDREASWLDFNERVLELVTDENVPLLERVRFTAIFSRNLDEFFMVRVAALRRRVNAGISTLSPSGATPRERLARVSATAHGLAERHAMHFADELRPGLSKAGVDIVNWDELSAAEQDDLHALFLERISPVLTPLAVDPAHPFPYISGLSLNLAVVVREPQSGMEHFARVKVPPLLPRFLPADQPRHRYVPIEDVIAAHLPELFPGMEVLEASSFRVTRNEDFEVDTDVDNLLQALERELSQRRFGVPVRLEVDREMSEHVLDLLVRELEISEQEVFRLPAPLDLAGLWALSDLDISDLQTTVMMPETHAALRPSEGVVDLFAVLRRQDVLVHHPYQSFATSVQALIQQAASDPDVHAIKLALYRTSGESPIVDALVEAARSGKQVLVVVEIKARFDEQANIRWARKLEQAGCHVTYGLVGLKTHCKLALVVRSDPDRRLRRYVHIGTGNYNPKTANSYEDLGLLTSDEVIGADVGDLFNHLSGYTRHREYASLLVAPDSLRSGLEERIQREADHARSGRPSGISIKVNSLVDTGIIDALYRASQAGVPIDLLVRGMCALRPGLEGMSERIRVRSILGRFLEHSRIYRFDNDGHPETWIGSADVMDRNLDRRVEALARVRDPALRRRLDQLLDLAWGEGVDCWTLYPDGDWRRTPEGNRLVDFQVEVAARLHSQLVAVPDEDG